MKTTWKKLALVAGCMFIAATAPLTAQSDSGSSGGQGAQMNESAGAENEGTNWSWLGLLGLGGLFGLKRRHDAHDHDYRTARA